MKFKCEMCGEEFSSSEDCENHEKECLNIDNLIKRIESQKKEIEQLKSQLKIYENILPLNITPIKYDKDAIPWLPKIY